MVRFDVKEKKRARGSEVYNSPAMRGITLQARHQKVTGSVNTLFMILGKSDHMLGGLWSGSVQVAVHGPCMNPTPPYMMGNFYGGTP